MHEMFDCVDFESKKQEAKSKKPNKTNEFLENESLNGDGFRL